ncbi:MAG: HmuY family protein [Gemmatimonadales bacterium]
MTRPPFPIIILAVLFGAAMVWLVVTALLPQSVPTFAPRTGPSRPAAPGAPDTVTIDARDPDQWQFFAFDRGLLVPPDTAAWDVGVRRFHMIVAGAAAAVDTLGFAALAREPSQGFEPTTLDRDTLNRALARWYRYSMFSHLLRPRPRVYVIRTAAGRYVKLEVLSYYCPGPEPGCLTFRYAVLR